MSDDFAVRHCPPEYPSSLRPWSCRHSPQFVVIAVIHTVRAAGRYRIETEHAVCLACGRPMPCTFGGNVLVDLARLWEEMGWQAQIGARALQLRERWSAIAVRLFDKDGWTGRHERVARLIDPNLTMRIEIRRRLPDGRHLVAVGADQSYWRCEESVA